MSAYDPQTPPGENLVHESNVIYQVLQDLAPELLAQAPVYQQLKKYIFPPSSNDLPSRGQILRLLRENLKNPTTSNIELIMTVLEGARAFQQTFELKQPSDFDQQMYLRQEAALNRFGDGDTTSNLYAAKNEFTRS